MEIKIESGTVSLTTEDTAEGLAEALVEIAKRFGNVSKSLAPDTKITMFNGTDWDMRRIDAGIQLSVRSALGWTAVLLTDAQASTLLKQLGAAIAEPNLDTGAVH